jgi:hypothetical protein
MNEFIEKLERKRFKAFLLKDCVPNGYYNSPQFKWEVCPAGTKGYVEFFNFSNPTGAFYKGNSKMLSFLFCLEIEETYEYVSLVNKKMWSKIKKMCI